MVIRIRLLDFNGLDLFCLLRDSWNRDEQLTIVELGFSMVKISILWEADASGHLAKSSLLDKIVVTLFLSLFCSFSSDSQHAFLQGDLDFFLWYTREINMNSIM